MIEQTNGSKSMQTKDVISHSQIWVKASHNNLKEELALVTGPSGAKVPATFILEKFASYLLAMTFE
jgi:hypothetical protein